MEDTPPSSPLGQHRSPFVPTAWPKSGIVEAVFLSKQASKVKEHLDATVAV